jgi:hypothetical protein
MTTYTSTDGVITAVTDPDLGAVRLLVKANLLPGYKAPAVNLARNPDNESTQSLTAWSNCTASRSVTTARSGAASTLLKATAAGSASAMTPTGSAGWPVVPGITYSLSVYAYCAATSRTCTVQVAWWTSSGTLIGGVAVGVNNTAVNVGNWAARPRTTDGVGLVAPAGAAFASALVTFAGLAANELVYVDDLQFERGLTATPFCSGDLPDCVWMGTAHSSISVRPAYRFVTVQRGPASVVTVRGFDQHQSADGVVMGVDLEAPQATPVDYWAVASNGLAETSESATLAFTTDAVTSGLLLLKHLQLGGLSMPVEVAQGGMPAWQYANPQTILSQVNVPASLVLGDTMKLPTGTLTVLTYSDDEYDALQALVDAGGVLLMQSPPGVHERDRYVIAGAMQEGRLGDTNQAPDARSWQIPLIVTDRPNTAGQTVSLPGYDFDDLYAAHPTWNDWNGHTFEALVGA